MTPSPEQYYPQQYNYYPAVSYWTAQLQGFIPVVMGIAMAVAMGAWALSLVKKAFRGEEVGFPL